MGREFHFEMTLEAFKKGRSRFPGQIARMARSHFIKSFALNGFNDTPFVKWPRRKFPRPTTRKSLRQRGLLVESGKMKNSIQIMGRPTFEAIKIGSTLSTYAKIHNEGGTTHPKVTRKMQIWAAARFSETGRAIYRSIATTKKKNLDIEIPKRQFIGKSRKLRVKISLRIRNEIQKALKLA